VKKVLVADDELQVRELLRVFLEKEGFLVKVASSVEEVKELLEKEKIDLLLLDYNLFGKKIEELISKAKFLNKDSKIFILSGFNPEILEKSLASKELIEGLLSKAEDIDKILERIIQALS